MATKPKKENQFDLPPMIIPPTFGQRLTWLVPGPHHRAGTPLQQETKPVSCAHHVLPSTAERQPLPAVSTSQHCIKSWKSLESHPNKSYPLSVHSSCPSQTNAGAEKEPAEQELTSLFLYQSLSESSGEQGSATREQQPPTHGRQSSSMELKSPKDLTPPLLW